MSLSAVSEILWRERELLELLVFKLEEEQLLLGAGRRRWLAHAGREVEMVRQEICRVELLRAVEVEALAAELEIGSNLSLRQLAAAVEDPWRSIFVDHRRALLNTAREIRAVAHASVGLLQEGATEAEAARAWLEGPDDEADATTGDEVAAP